jgi:hypothetical protein
MADHPLSPGGSAPAWPDWPAGGRIRPLLSTRVERVAKAFLGRLRAEPGAPTPPQSVHLDRVYAAVASARPPAATDALRTAFRNAVEPSQAVDASFAALALALAAQHRPRTEGLLAFLELCYPPTELDAGARRMGGRLQGYALAPGSRFANLEYESGWPVLAAGVRRLAQSMRFTGPVERRFGRELGPRLAVVRLSGGLGNQLFQYAAALAYARRIHAPLRLDLANYEGDSPHREFLLGRLRLSIRRANSYDMWRTRLRPHRETRGMPDNFLFSDHGSAWLCGFWEDVSYFADIGHTVRHRFRPRDNSIVTAAQELIQRARRTEGPVVGVHLRRGDRGPGGRAFSPLSSLPASYYRQAARRFPAESNFLVFSDTPEDISWCRHHLGLAAGANVSFGEGRDAILDMFALAQCDHVILSSGTFSWWAGYLGERPGRRVVVPNVYQGLSAERVMLPPATPPQPGWEEVTLASGDLG